MGEKEEAEEERDDGDNVRNNGKRLKEKEKEKEKEAFKEEPLQRNAAAQHNAANAIVRVPDSSSPNSFSKCKNFVILSTGLQPQQTVCTLSLSLSLSLCVCVCVCVVCVSNI